MPIYEYRCQECGQEFEVIQKFSDEPLSQCKSCNGSVSKLISQTSFRLKGSGWYVTDYAKGRSGPDANGTPKSDSGASSSSDSAGSDSSTSSSSTKDSKPASKATESSPAKN